MTRLMVLGMLTQRPMSGYEIQQYLQLSYADNWAGIQTGSIYHILKKMDSEGLITVQATERTGNRSRTVYRITSEGQRTFKQLLKDTLSKPDLAFPTALYTSVSFLSEISANEAVKAIEEHIGALEKELELWNTGEKIKSEHNLPLHTRMIFTNGRKHMEVNLQFLHELKNILTHQPVEGLSYPSLENNDQMINKIRDEDK